MISLTKLLFNDEYAGDDYRYKDTAKQSTDGVSKGRGPIVVWNSTRSCNLKCRHCYMNSDSKKYKNELTTEEAKRFLEELADFKVPAILFSGGEPLLRPDFFELAEYAVKIGVRPTLSTNGTLITDEVARRFKEIGITYVGISLDGIGNINDEFRGQQGAFVRAMEGIRACKKVNQRVGLRFTLNKHNFSELENIFDFIEKEDIDRACFYHLVYSGRGEKMAQEDLSHEETRQAMDIIVKRSRDYDARALKKEILTVDNHADGIYLYLLAQKENNEKLAQHIFANLRMNGGNRSGMAFAAVDPLGYVHPDQFTQHHTFGNVREKSFGEIWTSRENEILRGMKDRKPLLKGRCAKCKFLELCNGNFRTRAEAVTGDFWESDPACYLTDAEIE